MKLFALLFFALATVAQAQIDLDKYADAIKKVENSTKFPYGIKSIANPGKTAITREVWARRICINTVRNNYRRWQRAGSPGAFEDYLANVYCPPSADPRGNVAWKKNIRALLK